MPVDYEVKGADLVINTKNWVISPSIEDSEGAMAIAIDKLVEVKNVSRLVMSSYMDIEYAYDDFDMLKEIADAYDRITRIDRLLDAEKFGPGCAELLPQRMTETRFLVSEVLRKDPVGAFIRIDMLVTRLRKEMMTGTPMYNECTAAYLQNVLEPIRSILLRCRLIQRAKAFAFPLKLGSRTAYREIFRPTLRPKFMNTKYFVLPPHGAKLIERYYINSTLVEVYKHGTSVRLLYHISPPEFRLTQDKYDILDEARRYLAAHKPTEAEFVEPERARESFMSINKDLIRDVSNRKGMQLQEREIIELAEILSRYTTGFGVLELLLSDEKIQDIYVNSPVGLTPIYVNHSDFEECETNLVPTIEDAEAWATRFRLYSGRPLDEANPVLDTEMMTAGGRARVAAITRSLSLTGLAFAFRRHREMPWTFPLFIKANFMNPLYAGLMSFIIDGGRALLVAGGRGSGKSSLLGAMMLELMRRFRIITVEDTPELAVNLMRQIGYNIESLKSRSVITQVETELSSEEALRTSLRLGDSALVIGEVRSKEAVALFEAMRIGALANIVAGTIHGESSYGVYDRVVHDLGVPPTSFKALDVITICNKLKSPDGLHSFRRVVDLTEVRKKWKEDPMDEGGFVPLMQYSAKEDKLKPTDILLEGESEVLNEIAKRVRDWHGAWDLVWDNITLRSRIKETIVDQAVKLNRPEILEASWTVESNEMFHLISDDVRAEVGGLDSKMIYDRWLEWFKGRLKS